VWHSVQFEDLDFKGLVCSISRDTVWAKQDNTYFDSHIKPMYFLRPPCCCHASFGILRWGTPWATNQRWGIECRWLASYSTLATIIAAILSQTLRVFRIVCVC